MVLLVHSAILCVFGVLGLKHKVAFVVSMHAFHLFVLLLVNHSFFQFAGQVLLVQHLLDLGFRLFAVESFRPMLLHCAPLIDVAPFSERVIALLIVVEGGDLVHLLVERLLDPMNHLESIHNRISTSLRVHLN